MLAVQQRKAQKYDCLPAYGRLIIIWMDKIQFADKLLSPIFDNHFILFSSINPHCTCSILTYRPIYCRTNTRHISIKYMYLVTRTWNSSLLL